MGLKRTSYINLLLFRNDMGDLSGFVEDLRQRVDLAEHVKAIVKLGRNNMGKCPFHEEKTPSFHVTSDFFHCFGCGKSGDVIGFYREYHGLTFIEAVTAIAEKEGISVPTFGRAEPKIRTYEVLEAALSYFHNSLMMDRGIEVYEFLLEKRKISRETIQRWKLGYAPDSWDELHTHLQQKGFTAEELERQSLITQRKEASGYYNFFRNRIMIPLVNHAGKLIGFAGRAIDADQIKYLNSREQTSRGKSLYNKKTLLFGLYPGLSAVREQKSIMVTEGYFNVISSHQSGIENVVAVGGTAFTEQQARLIKRLTSDVVFVMDGDSAGIAAAKKAVKVAYGSGLTPQVALLPEGTDLDDICKLGDKESVMQTIHPEDILQFHLRTTPSQTSDEKTRILDEMIEYLSLEKDVARKFIWISDIATALHIPVQIVEQKCVAYHAEQLPEQQQVSLRKIAALYIANLFHLPSALRRHYYELVPESDAFSDELKALYGILQEGDKENHEQLAMPMVPMQNGQHDFIASDKAEQVIAYLKDAYQKRKIAHIPLQIVRMAMEPLPVKVDICANILHEYAIQEEQGKLFIDLLEAQKLQHTNRLTKIQRKLEELMYHG
ncbi:DNA primase [Candidatus Woesearchaeota archaeon]|nr:MAG: DNA primase [Candidatus Woesearchaeota archaeon]